MSIFDKLNNKGKGNDSLKETFKFEQLPESLNEFKGLKEASLDNPFKTAALTVVALCVYAVDREIGKDMLNFLRGPRPLSPMDLSFLNDRLMDQKQYVPFSFFDGATPENDYTPSKPYTITIQANQYSDDAKGYKRLLVKSGGADSLRIITLRETSDGKWFLWEQAIMADIRKPKSQDPWA